MKILALADLHRSVLHPEQNADQDKWIAGLLTSESPDVVVVAGDIFPPTHAFNPYAELANLLGDLPVVCTLGNHEFWYHTVDEVLDFYRQTYDPGKWDVHYLDVVGHYDIGDVCFLGNVLWYDGSMSTIPGQDVGSFAGHCWRDYEIRDFDWAGECRKCVEQIKSNVPEDDRTTVLVTHCVPNMELDAHTKNPSSPYNAYGGVTWLLDEIHPDIAICGHSHLPVLDMEINGTRCWNVGNDYSPPFRHVSIDL